MNHKFGDGRTDLGIGSLNSSGIHSLVMERLKILDMRDENHFHDIVDGNVFHILYFLLSSFFFLLSSFFFLSFLCTLYK